jgi:16S rRNA pseudouridine516 synthase
MAGQIRLDKYLADMGIGTRSEIKQWIRKGRVKVNETVMKKPETKVLADSDLITLDDRTVNYQAFVYFMMNKPAGVVSATRDRVDQTIIDLIKDKQGKELFPVGRLDKDTEGLLLVTNDGDLAHRLLSPRKHVDKVYYAKVKGRVTKEEKAAFLEGVVIESGYHTLPADLTIIKSDEISEIMLTIREGKYHQVKQMFEAVGKEVLYLKRISMGGLELDPGLLPGQYRSLMDFEVAYLKSLYQSERGKTNDVG